MYKKERPKLSVTALLYGTQSPNTWLQQHSGMQSFANKANIFSNIMYGSYQGKGLSYDRRELFFAHFRVNGFVFYNLRFVQGCIHTA